MSSRVEDGATGIRTMTGIGERLMNMKMRNILMVAGLAGVSACGSAEAGSADEAAASEEFARVINVQVAPITTQTFVEEIRLTSVAMANRDVMLEAQETGAIVELFADRGDWVADGDPIAKIDDRILLTQVAQATAAAELTRQTWERRKRLWEEDQVGSEIAYLEARYAAEQSQATLDGLQERLDRTTMRAPFSGILDERHVDVGTMVGPGVTIGRLVDTNPIKVFAGVPERYASNVRVGAGAQLRFESLGEQAYESRIRFVGTAINPQSRTFPIEVVLPNRDGAIKPQMVASMAITRQEVADAMVVPQDALVRVEDGYVVYVAIDQGGRMVAEERVVELGASRRNLVVVESGVEIGEQLIVVGQKSVASGDRVNIVG